jgi:hypothetical protein
MTDDFDHQISTWAAEQARANGGRPARPDDIDRIRARATPTVETPDRQLVDALTKTFTADGCRQLAHYIAVGFDGRRRDAPLIWRLRDALDAAARVQAPNCEGA